MQFYRACSCTQCDSPGGMWLGSNCDGWYTFFVSRWFEQVERCEFHYCRRPLLSVANIFLRSARDCYRLEICAAVLSCWYQRYTGNFYVSEISVESVSAFSKPVWHVMSVYKSELNEVNTKNAVTCLRQVSEWMNVFRYVVFLNDGSNNKKLSYRWGTARCVVSIEILPIATQQCRNYLYHKSWPNRWYEVGDLVGGNAW